jgi:hypothetical protein
MMVNRKTNTALLLNMPEPASLLCTTRVHMPARILALSKQQEQTPLQQPRLL